MKTLLYQLLHRGHRSSSAVRSANTSGFWPSLRNKSALLLPWMPRAQDFQTLPSFAPPLNDSLQSGSSGSYEVGRCYGYPGGYPGVYDFPENQVGGDSSLILQFPTGDPHWGSSSLILSGDMIHRTMMSRACNGVYWSLVGLAIYHRGKLSEVFSGTIVHPDGIIATSANCFKPLKGTEFKISVRLLHNGAIHKGVLLEADFCSDIAFVKIKSCHRLIAATFGKLDSMQDKAVVAGGCILKYSSWNYATSDYNLGFLRLDAGGSIDQEMENPESHNEKKSGQLIKAEILCVTRSCIGGPLVNMDGEFFAIIHNFGLPIEATPIDDVFKYLVHFKKHGVEVPCDPSMIVSLVVVVDWHYHYKKSGLSPHFLSSVSNKPR